jgi:effector-binding domain-containing protein
MTLEISAKTISPKQVLSMTHNVRIGGLNSAIEQSLEKMETLVKEQKVEIAGPPFGIYHGAINEKEDGPIEICLPVRGHVQGNEHIQVKQLHGGAAACVTLLGKECEYPNILKGYEAASAWINQNGHQKSGPPREIWHSGPGPDAKMEIAWFFR